MDVSRVRANVPVSRVLTDRGSTPREGADAAATDEVRERRLGRGVTVERMPAPGAEARAGHEHGARDPFAGVDGAEALLDRFLEARSRIGDRMHNAIANAPGEQDAAAFRRRGLQASQRLEDRFLNAIEALQPADAQGPARPSADVLLDQFLTANRQITVELGQTLDGLEGAARRDAHVAAQQERDGLQDRLLNALGFGPRPGPVADPAPTVDAQDVAQIAAEAPLESPTASVTDTVPGAGDQDVETALAERLFEAIGRIDDRARGALENAGSDAERALIRERAGEARDAVAARFLNALSFERGTPRDFSPDSGDRALISNFLEERFKLDQRAQNGLEGASDDAGRDALLASLSGERDDLTARFLNALSRPGEASAPDREPVASNEPDEPRGPRIVRVGPGGFGAERAPGAGGPSAGGSDVSAAPGQVAEIGASEETGGSHPPRGNFGRVLGERISSLLDRFEQRAERILEHSRGDEVDSQIAERLEEAHQAIEERFQNLIQALRARSSEEA